nr:MAG TPA: hypothetical protein [Caudoviricetes sp.]
MVYLMRQTVNLFRHGGDTLIKNLLCLIDWIKKLFIKEKKPVSVKIQATNSVVITIIKIHKD